MAIDWYVRLNSSSELDLRSTLFCSILIPFLTFPIHCTVTVSLEMCTIGKSLCCHDALVFPKWVVPTKHVLVKPCESVGCMAGIPGGLECKTFGVSTKLDTNKWLHALRANWPCVIKSIKCLLGLTVTVHQRIDFRGEKNFAQLKTETGAA